MKKLLIVGLLFCAGNVSAQSYCDTQTTGLLLPVPDFNTRGHQWGTCMRNSFIQLSTSAASLGTGTTAYFKKINVDEIGGLNNTDITISSAVTITSSITIQGASLFTGAHTIPDNTITESKIIDGAVTTSKLSADSVTASKLAGSSVTTAKLDAEALDGFSGKVNFTSAISDCLNVDSANDTLVVDCLNNMVGVGTASPGAPLDVRSASGGIEYQDTTAGVIAEMKADDSAVYIGSKSGANLNLVTGDLAKITILNSNGNVGIGTVSPDTLLHVSADSINACNAGADICIEDSTGPILEFNSATNISGGIKWSDQGGDNIAELNFDRNAPAALTLGTFYAGGDMRFLTGVAATAMTIDSSQNVGIGTASPSEELEISKSQSAATRLLITNANAGANATAGLKMTTDGGNSFFYHESIAGGDSMVIQPASGSDLKVIGGAGEVFRIESGGNVGIGTDSPAARLEVQPIESDAYTLQVSSQNGNSVMRIDRVGHRVYGGATPTVNFGNIVGNDNVGRITLGADGGGVTLTFANAWTNAPSCTCEYDHANFCRVGTITTTAVTFYNSPSTGFLAYYSCVGYE